MGRVPLLRCQNTDRRKGFIRSPLNSKEDRIGSGKCSDRRALVLVAKPECWGLLRTLSILRPPVKNQKQRAAQWKDTSGLSSNVASTLCKNTSDCRMDKNPYLPPQTPIGMKEARSPVDRDQCPQCEFRQRIWSAVNRPWSYTCPECGIRLVVRVPREGMILRLLSALAIGAPAIVFALTAGRTNVGWSVILSLVATLLLVAYGSFYVPCRYGRLSMVSS